MLSSLRSPLSAFGSFLCLALTLCLCPAIAPAEGTGAASIAPAKGPSVAPAKNRRAPVEDPNRIEHTYGPHSPHEAAPEAPPDWTTMKAWDHGQSNLSQTGYQIRPAGKSIRVGDRVLGIALARAGRFLLAKTDAQVVVVDADEFKVVNHYRFPEIQPGHADWGSMHGLAVGGDGSTVCFTGDYRKLYVAALDARGDLTMGRAVDLSAGGKPVNPLGVALSPDGKLALVALSIANELAVVDLPARKVLARLPVGGLKKTQ